MRLNQVVFLKQKELSVIYGAVASEFEEAFGGFCSRFPDPGRTRRVEALSQHIVHRDILFRQPSLRRAAGFFGKNLRLTGMIGACYL